MLDSSSMDRADVLLLLLRAVAFPDGPLLFREEDRPLELLLAVEAGVLATVPPLPVLHLNREAFRTMASSSWVCGGILILVIPVSISVGLPLDEGISLLMSFCVVVNMFRVWSFSRSEICRLKS